MTCSLVKTYGRRAAEWVSICTGPMYEEAMAGANIYYGYVNNSSSHLASRFVSQSCCGFSIGLSGVCLHPTIVWYHASRTYLDQS